MNKRNSIGKEVYNKTQELEEHENPKEALFLNLSDETIENRVITDQVHSSFFLKNREVNNDSNDLSNIKTIKNQIVMNSDNNSSIENKLYLRLSSCELMMKENQIISNDNKNDNDINDYTLRLGNKKVMESSAYNSIDETKNNNSNNILNKSDLESSNKLVIMNNYNNEKIDNNSYITTNDINENNHKILNLNKNHWINTNNNANNTTNNKFNNTINNTNTTYRNTTQSQEYNATTTLLNLKLKELFQVSYEIIALNDINKKSNSRVYKNDIKRENNENFYLQITNVICSYVNSLKNLLNNYSKCPMIDHNLKNLYNSVETTSNLINLIQRKNNNLNSRYNKIDNLNLELIEKDNYITANTYITNNVNTNNKNYSINSALDLNSLLHKNININKVINYNYTNKYHDNNNNNNSTIHNNINNINLLNDKYTINSSNNAYISTYTNKTETITNKSTYEININKPNNISPKSLDNITDNPYFNFYLNSKNFNDPNIFFKSQIKNNIKPKLIYRSDCLRKRIKTLFYNYMYEKLNTLIDNNTEVSFQKLPKNLVVNLNFKLNHNILNMTIKELFELIVDEKNENYNKYQISRVNHNKLMLSRLAKLNFEEYLSKKVYVCYLEFLCSENYYCDMKLIMEKEGLDYSRKFNICAIGFLWYYKIKIESGDFPENPSCNNRYYGSVGFNDVIDLAARFSVFISLERMFSDKINDNISELLSLS